MWSRMESGNLLADVVSHGSWNLGNLSSLASFLSLSNPRPSSAACPFPQKASPASSEWDSARFCESPQPLELNPFPAPIALYYNI